MIALLLAASLGLMQFEGTGAQVDQAQLAKRIQESLEEIDAALLQATEADAVTDEIARARQLHLNTIRDIEQLIESLEYQLMNPPPSGGGSGQPSGSGQGQSRGQPRPQPSDGSQQEQGRAPEQQPQSGSEPGAEDESEAGQAGGRPRGSASDRQAGDQPPAPDEVEPFTRSDTDGRWGLLPPKVQEQLNNLHVDDVPGRYRDWLDAYVKAMRKLEEP